MQFQGILNNSVCNLHISSLSFTHKQLGHHAFPPSTNLLMYQFSSLFLAHNFIMKVQLLFLLCVILIHSTLIDTPLPNEGSTFDSFLANPHIEAYRASIIRENIKMIQEHNSNPDATFKMQAYSMFVGLTMEQAKARYFSTLIQADFHQIKLQGKMAAKVDEGALKDVVIIDLSQRYVTPVRFQGACGNCYAFAITDSINLVNKRNYGNAIPLLSPQDLTDCSTQIGVLGYRNMGCNGGSLYISIEYSRIYGINSLSDNPISTDTVFNRIVQPCRLVGPKYRIRSWAYFGDNNCFSRIDILQKGYAVSIAVAGGNPYFMNYKAGIISGCGGAPLDHAVTLVGVSYNSNNLGMSFFKCKNSWGYGWGEGGFVRVSIGQCGTCSVGFFALQ